MDEDVNEGMAPTLSREKVHERDLTQDLHLQNIVGITFLQVMVQGPGHPASMGAQERIPGPTMEPHGVVSVESMAHNETEGCALGLVVVEVGEALNPGVE